MNRKNALRCPVKFCVIGGHADDKATWCDACPAHDVLPRALAKLDWARYADILEFHSPVPGAHDLWLIQRGAGPKLYLGYIRNGRFYPSSEVKRLV